MVLILDHLTDFIIALFGQILYNSLERKVYAFSSETLESIVKRYARQNLYHKDKWKAKLFRWHLKFFIKS